ncbi:hypothetical protein HETIRDRAFT_417928 [Heterobasidion irregulare TC 32-1]|uniref:Uncharacterized protein n=1 Tax=Heterobasidion irregulare (strain TC 32-1) TaxID=747525 RepID=W4K7S6_HETIT|nr:uncharacterized protein HETIRDRAFT_417928 [Heterobasidion irregulare TC 32-1]ETW81877.1 hypothetical protein HETIRDRAFT_417928 [Heterobasidion irregulare TC 32-1]
MPDKLLVETDPTLPLRPLLHPAEHIDCVDCASMSATGSSVPAVSSDFSPEIIQVIATVASQSAFFGIFVVIMLFSTYFLCCKGFETKANVMMLSVTTIMFATSTTYWAFTLTISVMSVQALYHPDKITLQEGEFIGGLYIAQMYLPMINYVLSDTVVAWRAWVLWQHNTRISIIPFVPLLGSLGTPRGGLFNRLAVYKVKGFKSQATDSLFAAWVLSLATNVAATILIACKAWRHRRMIKSYLAHGGLRRTQMEKIFALLIESGALYCVLWVLLITTRFSVVSAPECELIQDASVQIAVRQIICSSTESIPSSLLGYLPYSHCRPSDSSENGMG